MDGYWVASHITGFFIICNEHPDSLYKGSKGAGFSISRGVKTLVEFSEDKKNHFFFNDNEVDINIANVSSHVLKRISANLKLETGINIYHFFEVPLSSGYGASAAGAVGTAFALNDLLDLGLKEKKLLAIAHIAEVEEGGGLGDVIGLYEGGWEYRVREGAPFIGKTERMKVEDEYKIATISFGDLPTQHVIKNEEWKKRINTIGVKAFELFIKNPTVTNFVKQSLYFSVNSKLETNEIKNFRLTYQDRELFMSQIMLGNCIFILYKKNKELPEIPGVVKEKICTETIKKL